MGLVGVNFLKIQDVNLCCNPIGIYLAMGFNVRAQMRNTRVDV